jgi:acetylornithine/N-succinyldiaminopimelate aminotransferase
LFAHEHYGVTPDIMTLAKALGNGLPIGVMLATDKVAEALGPGSHASTFGGTPLVTSVALKTLRILTEDGILDQVAAKGDYLCQRLLELKETHPVIHDVRGKGLLIGVELSIEGASIVTRCMEKGFLINCIQDKVLRLAPPLIIEKEQIDAFIECLAQVLPK